MTEINERAAAIRWIQTEMADYGLTMEELEAAGCFHPPPPLPPPPPAPAPPPVVCYRNAAGQSWGGQGEMPEWLRRAVNAGRRRLPAPQAALDCEHVLLVC
ncbi:Histone-like protein H-NS C-terminal domain-containing protein [Cupriavidus necator]|uniref:H-NS histone family protein n=1 Tax=Cupriavidus necator TaxID=106590 RepID=UPI003F736F29